MPRIPFIKSEVRASEIVEDDCLDIGGQKFRVINTHVNAYGQIVLRLFPLSEPDINENILVVAQHLLFKIQNQAIPTK